MDMPLAHDNGRDINPAEHSTWDEIASTAETQPIKLIYICGYGRSGSTLLDILLGQQRSMFGGGEIIGLSQHVYLNDEYCACGERVRSCSFWQPVVEQWHAQQPPRFIEEFRRAQWKVGTVFSPRRWFGSRDLETFSSHTARLMRLMSDRSGKAAIVDSSKWPGRGMALAKIKGIDLHVIHLVRDVRGVAWSLSKAYEADASKGLQRVIVPKPLLYSAARWAYVNLAAEWLCRKVGPSKYLRIRYEDVAADPAGSLQRIASLAGIALDPRDYEAGEFNPVHQVAGNRLRMQKGIRVKSDDSWRKQMPEGKRRLLTRACGFLLARYGYPMGV
ncbi:MULTISPECIES: sulfotransferase family protein [Sphingobium]|jgi:hypothetical protein|uniref:Sulfotransferase family protein n=1 Tax=Sphingobium tyrosinilyticum TaxID=2715436 RepID=A0ABV9EV37_9SPHN|nr:sulfotransferase [Sphingobium sp. EP60837]ANI77556.1 hypothetical protein EP837_01122 [Sphingobium sp. EP60837]